MWDGWSSRTPVPEHPSPFGNVVFGFALSQGDHLVVEKTSFLTETGDIDSVVAGTGLYLKNTGDCNYTFHADHNISAVPYCSGDTVSDKFFRHLKFSTGLVVQSNESACDFEITSPIRIVINNINLE